MPANRKIWQTIINVFAEIEQERIKHKNKLEFIKGKIQTLNLDPAGTKVEGKLAELNARAEEIIKDAGKPIAQQIIAARKPSHRNWALGELSHG